MNDWNGLIRFNSSGLCYWAEIEPGKIPPLGTRVKAFRDIGPISVYQGAETVVVEELLPPLPCTTNPIICIGLNYLHHAKEAQIQVPSDPVMWYKPPAALAGPDEDIPILSDLAQNNFLDFELVVVLSRKAKNVPEDKARDYILGYTVGNDLTLRKFQVPQRCGGQFTFAKSFDKFAPIGPSLLSVRAFAEKKRRIVTRVNGKTYQDSPLEFIHSPEKLISYLSHETTLPAGTTIMTGTLSGVGWFQDPKLSLKDGDVVEVEVEDTGVLRNRIVYTNSY